jgi:hypothetical protein
MRHGGQGVTQRSSPCIFVFSVASVVHKSRIGLLNAQECDATGGQQTCKS